MGRIYVDSNSGQGSTEERSNLVTGRLYVGTTDAEGNVVKVEEPATPGLPDSEPDAPETPETPETPVVEPPAGNATREEWADYARTQGAVDEDLVDDDGKDLGRDALREKYSPSTSGG